jgi:CheY-like chemotaxis protein
VGYFAALRDAVAYGNNQEKGDGATTYPLEVEQTPHPSDDPSEGARLADILSTVSHELRTPATLIVGLASTLTANRERMTSSQVSDAVVRLERQAKRMVRLLDDLLDASRVGTGHKLQLSMLSVNLAAAVEGALAAAAPPSHVSVATNIAADLTVYTDPYALERSLVNLLRNAFRYGGPNVVVEAWPSIGGVALSVSDDGAGVAPEIVPHLFEPFRASAGGTGLGLVIVRAIAEASGGDISYEPAQPTGARFTLRLRDEARRPDPQPRPRAPITDQTPIILIVDDEPDVLFLLRLTLEHAGYRVEEAPHGAAALETIRRLLPDLVITDLMMPVVDGRELIQRLRERAETAALPIMLLSASPDNRSGADRVMRKPFDPRQLMRAIEELVGGKEG